MRILVNDHLTEEERYRQIFRTHNYEDNELIFVHGFQDFKEFIASQLATKQFHIDAIITGYSAFGHGSDILKAQELLYFKNSFIGSYSNSNFRIAAIPVILYSESTGLQKRPGRSFDFVVEKNSCGNHDNLVNSVERALIRWRKRLMDDLGTLGLNGRNLTSFQKSAFFKQTYKHNILPKSEVYFAQHTRIVSHEFIKCPSRLIYDWTNLTSAIIEEQIENYYDGVFYPKQPYSRQFSENNIDHPLLIENPIIMLRGNFIDFVHEKGLKQQNRQSKRCDFLLKTDFPEFLPTTFLEVKKKDVNYIIGKKRKDRYLSADMHKYLGQLWLYKKYAEDPRYGKSINNVLGYNTNKYQYNLLAGRIEEKEEFLDILNERLADHYPGLNVLAYEDLGIKAEGYLERFNRIKHT